MRGKGSLILRSLLLLFWLFIPILAIEPGKLGISWNAQLAAEPNDKPRMKFAWTSIVEFDGNVMDMFSDEEIVGMAKVAWADMKADWETKPWKKSPYDLPNSQIKQVPQVMTVIVHGKNMYFASSVRGKGLALPFTAAGHPKVREALITCKVKAGTDKPHDNKASCGEPMAAHIAFQSGMDSLEGAKVVTVNRDTVMAPCGVFDENGALTSVWGCNAFIRELGLVEIPEGTEGKDKDDTPDPRILPVCI